MRLINREGHLIARVTYYPHDNVVMSARILFVRKILNVLQQFSFNAAINTYN